MDGGEKSWTRGSFWRPAPMNVMKRSTMTRKPTRMNRTIAETAKSDRPPTDEREMAGGLTP
jgi:hypothetical protein